MKPSLYEIHAYVCLQNKVIIGEFSNHDDAVRCIEQEKEKDRISIMVTKKLRKLFQKDPSNFKLHTYAILEVIREEEYDA